MILNRFVIYQFRLWRNLPNLPDCDAEVKFAINLAYMSTNILLIYLL